VRIRFPMLDVVEGSEGDRRRRRPDDAPAGKGTHAPIGIDCCAQSLSRALGESGRAAGRRRRAIRLDPPSTLTLLSSLPQEHTQNDGVYDGRLR
jgi:hypothetical protein